MTRIVYNLASASDGSNNIQARGGGQGGLLHQERIQYFIGPNCVSLQLTLVEMYGSTNEPSIDTLHPSNGAAIITAPLSTMTLVSESAFVGL